jgi:hypothetical protein
MEKYRVGEKALEEITDVPERYQDFAVLTEEQATEYINSHYF